MYRFTTPMTIFALAVGFQSAHAAPPENVPSAVVHFADLDLSRSAGVTVLYQRLQGAAETVCAMRVTFDNPPLNVMGPQFVLEIREIMALDGIILASQASAKAAARLAPIGNAQTVRK